MIPRYRVKYVDPEKVYPYFGYAWPNKGECWINWDLRGRMLWFVVAHETYHMNDDNFYSHSKFRRELEAYWYALLRNPIGGIVAAIKVLSSWSRFVGLFEKKEIEWRG